MTRIITNQLAPNHTNRIVTLLMFFFLSLSSYGQTAIDLTNKVEIHTKINELYKNGDWDTAKNWLVKAIEKYPNDAELRILLGKYYIEKKQYKKALFELNKSLEFNPNNLDVKKLLLHIETVTQRYSSAIGYVNELLESSPYSKDLWLKKIDLYRQQGNPTEANRLLKRLSDIYPEDQSILRDINYQMEVTIDQKNKQGYYDEAIELNKKLLKTNSNNIKNYLNLINTYIKIGDYSNALIITDRGLNQFPNDPDLVLKKLSLYDQSQQYEAGLKYINQQKKATPSMNLDKQNKYFLSSSAQAAKDGSLFVLFGKLLDKNPADTEAFEIVFNQLVSQHQYDEALMVLNRHRAAIGTSKKLALKELNLFKAMGNTSKIKSITRKLNTDYPNDLDLEAAYAQISIADAKDAMADSNYPLAIELWKIVQNHGDQEQRNSANTGLYNAYFQSANYNKAEEALNTLLSIQPQQANLYFKKANLYYLLNRPDQAPLIYEEGLQKTEYKDRFYALIGYEELMVKIIKDALENHAIPVALNYAQHWLTQDPLNKQALEYAISTAATMKKWDLMKHYAAIATQTYAEDVTFKIKLAESIQLGNNNYEEALDLMIQEIETNPYHQKSNAAFIATVVTYSPQLLKEKKSARLLELTNKALRLDPKNKEIKYLKGLAYEQQKNDSAYYYQRYYEPTLLEYSSFKQRLNYLHQKSLKNEINLTHAISNFDDNSTKLNTSSFEYSRIGKNQYWTGRLNYTGRSGGQGIQAVAAWNKKWKTNWSHQIEFGMANDYFPKLIAQAALNRYWSKDWETEIGLGYRRLTTDEKLYNVVVSVSKEINDFRLSLKLNQFSLDKNWFYNLNFTGKYFIDTPKDYILFQTGIGSSTDVDVIDIQNLRTFSINNTQVGAGFGRLLTKNVSANIIGSWHNFKNQNETVVHENDDNSNDTDITTPAIYKNFYTLYFNIHVAF
ncbi:tetratricopeptide repeat protein [Flavobacterium sp. NKUCC04_CG]|uniref:tetratricopeptide repeat protein n=1 Tax=Flavobacterium sp. NKUCC04_CG TaxID=2842121 RepID=UPI001C5AC518|nr:tetratricopeptide repeat protein [Flavobacterium sp. NKUCC04_CG]MBW3520073.1 tetratricopeptide repeat protein [Flavobacterium sp. NKUCC04_CG]